MASTNSTSEPDAELARLLSQLSAPTSDAVHVPPPAAYSPATPTVDPASGPRLPELMGADALAASPTSFTPPPPPLLSPPPQLSPPQLSPSPLSPPPAPVVAPRPTQSPGNAHPPATDFSAILFAGSAASEGSARAGGPLLLPSGDPGPEEPDIARSTVGERIALVLAVVLPPIGLIASVVGAIGSTRRRGWVVGVLKAGITVGVVMTLLTGIGGSIGYTLFEQHRQHDETAASSSAFCATIRADPTMIQKPTFGWPAVAASIPDSLSAMQEYQARFAKLAKVSPSGIQADVTKIATAAQQIIASVTVARTVNDASNIAVMTSVADASDVPAWYAEYCS